MLSLPYKITTAGASPEAPTAEAATYQAATLALRTLKGEVDEPSQLQAFVIRAGRKPQLVAWINSDGSLGSFQGSENW